MAGFGASGGAGASGQRGRPLPSSSTPLAHAGLGGSRPRNAALGALLGVCVSVLAGLLQDRSWNWLPAEQQRKRVAWIARLEAGPPASSGTAQQQQAQQQAQAGGEQRAQQERARDTM